MFRSVLIANRGEIACRVARTLRAEGVRSVAVFSDADADAPHVRACDDAVRIGPAPAAESYLNPAAILDAARTAGAEAVHPGYGFLSENAAFAQAVVDAGLTWIGPPPAAIAAMGDKAEAKRRMIAAGVPCVPGAAPADQSDAALTAAAGEVGFPLMVKASAGGGGRGIRVVQDAADLPDALARARAEAEGAFGDGALLLERAVLGARHVEIQVFADAHGTTLHLGERDCSVQRRRQKVLEEAPCPAVDADLRARMGAAAVAAAEAVGYRGAGTVEFLLAPGGEFFFLEMNTRLQVEHPVTELVTGLDLVSLQLRAAAGLPLGIAQADVALTGHAIEARLCAEDAAFLPSIGPIALFRPAPGVRVDAGIETGGEVSPHYDSMVAKIVVHGADRAQALARLRRAVAETVLLGPETNAPFLLALLDRPEVIAGEATTTLVDEAHPDGMTPPAPLAEDLALAAALALSADRDGFAARAGVHASLLGWSSAAPPVHHVDLAVGTEAVEAVATALPGGWRITLGEAVFEVLHDAPAPELRATVNGRRVAAVALAPAEGDVRLSVDGRTLHARRLKPGEGPADAASGGRVTAPMPGLVVEVSVAAGDRVAQGDRIAVLEAMKMQHQITAPVAGAVAQVAVAQGAQLAAGDLIVEIEEDAAEGAAEDAAKDGEAAA